MAFVVKDRVKETSTTQGTSTFTLDGAVTGFQSFSAIGDGNTTYYTIVGGAEWEVGIGIYTASGTTLSRNTVLSSSNNGNLVNFSAGPKDVFVVYPSERAVVVDGTTIQVPNLAVLPVSAGGTGSNTATFSGENISSLNAANVTSGVLSVTHGGTGSTTASFSGANISSLNASNVTSGILAVDHGGTGSTTASFSGQNITSINANNISSGVLGVLYGGTGSNSATFVGENITSINASNISTGTLDNARTTASSSNGASTIVSRDASGNFSGHVITAVSEFSGSGANITSINAENISTGVLDVARGGTNVSTVPAVSILVSNSTDTFSSLSASANQSIRVNSGGTAWETFTVAGGIPAGGIIMWSGSIASIPSGWVICNGTNGTPDLRDRFVIGAGNTYAVAATGGSATNTLVEANLPSHTHSFSGTATTGNASSDHTHTYSATTGTQSADHTHTFSGSTGGQSVSHNHGISISDPGHRHSVPEGTRVANTITQRYADISGNINSSGAQNTGFSGTGISASSGNASNDHSHGYSGTTSGMSVSHTHGVSGTTSGQSVTHNHSVTVSGTSGATGSGTSFTNLPPYYALAYIMKT